MKTLRELLSPNIQEVTEVEGSYLWCLDMYHASGVMGMQPVETRSVRCNTGALGNRDLLTIDPDGQVHVYVKVGLFQLITVDPINRRIGWIKNLFGRQCRWILRCGIMRIINNSIGDASGQHY